MKQYKKNICSFVTCAFDFEAVQYLGIVHTAQKLYREIERINGTYSKEDDRADIIENSILPYYRRRLLLDGADADETRKIIRYVKMLVILSTIPDD